MAKYIYTKSLRVVVFYVYIQCKTISQTNTNIIFPTVCCGLANANRYAVKDTSGRAVFHVQEEGDGGYKSVFGPGRPYVMHVTDNYEREIITLRQTLISNLEVGLLKTLITIII